MHVSNLPFYLFKGEITLHCVSLILLFQSNTIIIVDVAVLQEELLYSFNFVLPLMICHSFKPQLVQKVCML